MITVKINSVDYTSSIAFESLEINQILTSQVDSANFQIKKYGSRTYVPTIGDDIGIYIDTTKIFGGTITNFTESLITNSNGVIYDVEVTDYTYLMDSKLVSATYSSQTIQAIIADLITNNCTGFTTVNVAATFNITKIVFNQIPVSQCIKRLADIIRYDWYVDENKDVHFFAKFTNTAPFNLTDTSGNYVNETLQRKIDGTQLVNVVKVRGGQYDGSTYTDIITVNGNNSTSFNLPYKFSNLAISVDTGAGYVSKVVGVDFIDTFATKDVLYNFQQNTIRFLNPLADTNKIQFSGNPKVDVLAIAEDATSIATYGRKEKLIRDASIEDLTIARQRAIGELKASKDPINTASFETYTSGLRTGMVINLNSSLRSSNTDFLIKRVNFRARSINEFSYKVELTTTQEYGLIELLQDLLTPDPVQAQESEVAETIKTDLATITITESITASTTSAYADTVTITITENIQKDPLGAGVEPTWVLAPYFPSSPTDTKREGLLDRSLKVY